MHFLLTALGSYGDVHPMVGLGAALRQRGHRVSIVASPYFEGVVQGAGLELLPLGTRDEYLQLVHHPDLWHPRRGQQFVFEYACVHMLRPLYELVTSHAVPGETILGAHGLDVASRIAGEKLNIPVASINFAPSMFLSAYQSPRLPAALTGDRVPRWLKRTQFWLAETMFVDRLLDKSVNQLRAELGLPPVGRFLTRWWHSTDAVLAMFPDWFAPPQPDWPTHTRTTGFPLWDATEAMDLTKDMIQFLEDGEPPIVFTPGSANAVAGGFFTAAVDACRQLDRRAILLTKFSEQVPPGLPATVRNFGFVPLSRVLPRAAAFVHHGGIGSCAQGLAAGVPQLVRPMAFDQFDNSLRLQRLGVAEELSVRRFRGTAVAAALDRLLTAADVGASCAKLAEKCDRTAGFGQACETMEALAR